MSEDMQDKTLPAGVTEQNAVHPVLVRFHESESGLKCIFRGRMDSLTSSSLEPELKVRLDAASGKRVVYDFADVDYVASNFLRLCIMAAKMTHGDFAILNPSPDVRKVLKISGLDNLVRGS